MEFGMAIGLAVLWGLAEFLPISAPGHMTLLQTWFGLGVEGPAWNLLLHAAALLAVVAAYPKRLWAMITHPLASELKWMILSIAPTIAVAYTIGPDIEAAWKGSWLGPCFLATSLILLVGDGIGTLWKNRSGHVTWYHALVMGAAQAFALFPGFTRAGFVLAGGLATGLKRKRAADFGFAMAIPAMIWAIVNDCLDISHAAAEAGAGFFAHLGAELSALDSSPWLAALAALVAGFLAIKLVVSAMRRGGLKWCVVYTCLLGLAVIAWQLMQGAKL